MKTFIRLSALSAVVSVTPVFAGLPAVGPDYATPTAAASTAPAFRDASDATTWKTAAPADTFARGEWWKLFSDPALDALQTQALAANEDLHAAAARVEQARATAGLARSNYWPQLAAGASVTREQTSRTTDNVAPNDLTTSYRLPLAATWELDLFGRVRRLTESARADAEATAANYESLRLALTAEVAANYFTFRALDREAGLLRDSVALRRRALDLVSARVQGGVAAELDIARAETELATAEAEIASVSSRRAAVQNALAVLLGRAAPDFTLPADTTTAANSASTATALPPPPAIPGALPSELLERRPDIAAAERSVAAANARIGVAQAAFFPSISLNGGAGFATGDIDRLTAADSRIWSIGPSLYLPIFQGGRNRANLARTRAVYDETVANYRQRVLVALREVQDALTATHLLADQSAAQDRAVASARRAASLAQTRYDAGFVSYFEVIDAQRTALATERAAAQLAALRLNTGVALIQALGGGWENPHRPTATLAAAAAPAPAR